MIVQTYEKAAILVPINFCNELSKTQFFLVSIINKKNSPECNWEKKHFWLEVGQGVGVGGGGKYHNLDI